MSELESFLNDESVAETPEASVDEVTEETTEETTVEQEETTETVDEPEGSTTEPEKDDRIPIAALLDEREKRQAAQRELDELKRGIDQNKPAEKTPDVLEDQEGFVNALDSRVNEAILNERANLSEFHARKQHADFDEKWPLVEKFLKDKQLGGEVLNHVDPYGHAFKLYDDNQEMERLKDPDYMDKLRAEIREEERKKLEEEKNTQDDKEAAKQKLAETLTPSLANQRAEGANKPVVDVADPLETTFNR